MKILVTGASRGLGLAIATHLGMAGNDVIGCARTDVKVAGITYIPGVNFEDRATLDKLDPVLQDCDCLVNNIGIAHDGLLATQGEDSIERVISVNLISTMVLTKRYARKRLARRSGGVVVNISSIIGIRGYAGLAAYSASKAGLDGFTRALSRELGSKGFRINSVLPGYMATEMSSALSKEQRDQIVRRTPLGRLAEVTDVANVVQFLISDAAAFITGQSIVVDGGITV